MKRQFDYVDYIIFVIIIFISVCIGLYQVIQKRFGQLYRRLFRSNKVVTVDENVLNESIKNENVDDTLENEENIKNSENVEKQNEESSEKSKVREYLTANSSMNALPVAFSLLATFFSSTSLLGYPAEVYQYGIQYWISIIGISTPTLLGAFIFGPMFSRLKVISVFEYFQIRFDSVFVRLLGVFYYLLRILMGMGIVIYGPATTLSVMTGIRPEYAIAVIGVVATSYTTIGGLKAVIYSDAFQLTVMFTGLIAIIIKGTYEVGGLSKMWQINYDGGRINFFNFNPNPFIRQSFWPLVFGNFVNWLFPYCMDQQMVQRFASAKSIRTAQTALLLNIPGVIFFVSFCCFTGLVLYSNYAECDPLSAKNLTSVENANQLMPFFVMDKLAIPGFSGLFLGSIFCAAMSSLSSALNSMSAIILQDFLKRFKYFKGLNDTKSALTAKIIVIICGFICTCFSFVISQLSGNLIQINNSINGSLGAPVIALFLLGVFVPFANWIGVSIGTLFGLAVGLWINFGAFIMKPVYPKLNLTLNQYCFNDIVTTSPIPLYTTTQNPMITLFDSNDHYSLRYDFTEGEATNLSGFNKFYSLSYVWFSTFSVLVAVIIGIIASLITIKHSKRPDERTLVFKCKRIKLKPSTPEEPLTM